MLQVSLTINTKNLWMVHFCHLLFPDYAQAVLTAQTTESTAGFPNCPKMSDEGTRCSLSFDRVRFKASVFFLLQKQRNRAELVLSVILPCLWQYLFRCNSTTKKKKNWKNCCTPALQSWSTEHNPAPRRRGGLNALLHHSCAQHFLLHRTKTPFAVLHEHLPDHTALSTSQSDRAHEAQL